MTLKEASTYSNVKFVVRFVKHKPLRKGNQKVSQECSHAPHYLMKLIDLTKVKLAAVCLPPIATNHEKEQFKFISDTKLNLNSKY